MTKYQGRLCPRLPFKFLTYHSKDRSKCANLDLERVLSPTLLLRRHWAPWRCYTRSAELCNSTLSTTTFVDPAQPAVCLHEISRLTSYCFLLPLYMGYLFSMSLRANVSFQFLHSSL